MDYLLATNGTKLLVDKDDLVNLRKYSWYMDGHNYAYTMIGNSTLFLHRLLCPVGEVVDHINRNTLDNRRSNLRPATRSQNAMNRGATKRSKTGYKGVFLNKKQGNFKAMIRIDYTLYYLGTFSTAEKAAAAYNEAAYKYFKDFAVLNIIPDNEGA